MTQPADMAERHARVLQRIAELSLEFAEDLQAAGLAAEDPVAKAALAGAYQKVARSARQAVFMEARLERDGERAKAAADAAAAQAAQRAVETRKTQLRAVLERRLHTERSRRDADECLADFDERLEIDALEDDFLEEPVHVQVGRLCAEYELTGKVIQTYTPREMRRRGGAGKGVALEPGWYCEIVRGVHGDAEAAACYREFGLQPPEAKARQGRGADPPKPPPEPWQSAGRLAPPMDLPSWECDDG